MRRLSAGQRRKAIKKQLGYLDRNLKIINKLGERVSLGILKNSSLSRSTGDPDNRSSNSAHFILRAKVECPIESSMSASRISVRWYARRREPGASLAPRYRSRSRRECASCIGSVLTPTTNAKTSKDKSRLQASVMACIQKVFTQITPIETRENRRYCRQRGIRLSGARLRERFSWDSIRSQQAGSSGSGRSRSHRRQNRRGQTAIPAWIDQEQTTRHDHHEYRSEHYHDESAEAANAGFFVFLVSFCSKNSSRHHPTPRTAARRVASLACGWSDARVDRPGRRGRTRTPAIPRWRPFGFRLHRRTHPARTHPRAVHRLA